MRPQSNDDQFQYAPSPLSPCEDKCSSEQKALVECVQSMQNRLTDVATRGQSENNNPSSNKEENPCLKTAIARWTECCAKANREM